MFTSECVPRHGVQFVVAHHRESITGVDHPAGNPIGRDLMWSAIDKVTKEDRLSFRMPPGASGPAISKFWQEVLEFPDVAVDVTNDVVVHMDCASVNQQAST
ncbi:hypothetical protein GCM10011404_30520 [Sphingomonas prati]|nr:hypothetical protein GCM10011404_30520 [Sphingomonas prati]